jgi:hypothetical protein
MSAMKTLGDNEESAKARYEIERATIDCAELSLFIGDAQEATLSRGNFEFGVEWGKLIFAWWDEGVSQSWRVTAYEIDRGELRLRATRGMGRETTLLTLRDPAKWREICGRENLPLGERRRRYAKTLSRLITKRFNGARVERLTAGPFRPRSGVGRYARLVLKSDVETILAIGVGEAESQDGVDGLLAAGLVVLAAFNDKRGVKDQAKRLWLCLPKGRSRTTTERVTLLDGSRLGAQIECFEVDECDEEMAGVRAVTQDELLNSHPRGVIWPGSLTPDEKWRERIVNLAPDLIETRRDPRSSRERFEIKGLEFAHLGAGGRVKFGVVGGSSEGVTNLVALTESNFGELEALVREIVRYRSADSLDRRHPFYSLRAEAWLESLLRRDIRRLDATFDERFVYSQIPAWRADERSVIDLLTVNHEGRLVVIEIKAAEDPQLPLQGTDYWLRVEQGRLRNEFKKRGLFEGFAIADRSPLLYLVAPRLRFHRTFEAVAQCVSPRIEAYRIGVNANWREGVKVHTRDRINFQGTARNRPLMIDFRK